MRKFKLIIKRLGGVFIYFPIFILVGTILSIAVWLPFWIITGKDFMDKYFIPFSNRCYEPFDTINEY